MSRFLSTLAPIVLFAAASFPARAIVFNLNNTSTGPSLYSGVAQLNVTGVGSCSGTLLSTGMHILTAGHCAAGVAAGDISVGFQFDDGFGGTATQTLLGSSVVLHPSWNLGLSNIDNIIRGVDFAVVALTAAADSRIQRYDIDRSNTILTGTAVTIVGFGQSGVGANDQGSGVRRAGANTIAGLWGNGFGQCQAGLNIISAEYLPICTVLQTSTINQGVSAFGDSGGAVFVNGTTIAGVNSFVKCGSSVLDCSAGNPNAIGIGAESGAARVSSAQSFIDAATGVTGSATVPEPSTYAMLTAGIAGLAFAKRRRK